MRFTLRDKDGKALLDASSVEDAVDRLVAMLADAERRADHTARIHREDVEGRPGESIGEAIDRALAHARHEGRSVTLRHNAVVLLVKPKARADDLMKAWLLQFPEVP